jgi:hypothetical protein
MKRGISRIVEQYGNLHEIIPPLVNKCGQHQAAQQLGVSAFTINRWLKANGYRRVQRYERLEPEAAQ